MGPAESAPDAGEGGAGQQPYRALVSVGRRRPAAVVAALENVRGIEILASVSGMFRSLQAVDELRPDLVVLSVDGYLDGGLRLLHRLRDPGRHASDIVLVTERPEAALIRSAAKYGVLSCLVPPFEEDAVSARANGWLNRWRRMTRLPAHGPLDQDGVDQIFPPKVGAHGPSPSGGTRDRVSAILREQRRGMSVSDIARRCRLSTVATSRYLRQLVDSGEVVMSLRYGQVGRPRHHYRWKSPADEDKGMG
ncbi:helix-turn-helix domain-containing protein [Actinophytocola sp. NPDC049390]|uniref:helix-turn-helix domain-containing protein n=1 Tax=Actinophytocola sp. NPDC049390 TaxID=3363894 RepID=UPI0037B4BA87